MKNFNLIKRLFMDSHEKQSPQRFGRYAAMLIMLLTLGVGQMWATVTIYAVGSMQKNDNSWVDEKTNLNCHNWGSSGTTWPGQAMTKWNDVSVDGHQVWKCNLKADANTNIIFNNGTWQTADKTINATQKAYPYPTYLNGTWYYSPRVCKALWESDQHAYGGRIYFDNSSASWGDTYMYFVIGHGSYVGYYRITNIGNTKLYYVDLGSQSWGDSKYVAVVGNSSSKTTGSGNPNNLAALTHFSDAYQYSLEYQSTYLVSMPSGTNCSQISMDYKSGGYSDFNSTQTINTVVKAAGGSYTSANSKATISITSYEMTGDGAVTKRTPSISTSAKQATVSAARTATTTLSVGDVATGYQFDGWYTAATGGTQLSSSKTYTYYPTAATTVYARFSEKMSTVTLTASPSGKGSFTIGGAAATSTTAGVTTTRSVTAVPISGYHFVSWAITGGASISSTSTNPTTVTGGGAGTAATLTATFAADDVYTLTVAAGTGISSVTGTTNNIKAGNNIAITATVASGYTWSTWTKTGAGTLSTYTAGTKNQTVTVGTAGDITLTASATEIMRTITISGGTVYGGAATSTTAGVATAAKITANAPAAGKKFTGWTLGSGVSLKGGYSLTDRTIEIYSTANATVTANYADRASVKLYFPKPSGWTKVYAFAWKEDVSSNGDWPGVEMTSYETVRCVNYYYYLYYTEGDGIGGDATGSDTWDQVIFNNNSGTQTNDLAISNGHYYYKADAAASSGRAAALASAWLVKGDFNSWGETDALTPNCGANTATKTISLTTGDKTFKIYNAVNDQWWRITGNITDTKSATTMNNGDGDMTLTPSVAGSYIFTVGSTNSTPTLAVTYPTTYTVTYSVSPSGAANAITTSPSVSSGGKVLSGTSVTFTHAAAKTGYTWYRWENGSGSNLGTESTYTATINANTTVVAKYTENSYNVTVSAGSGGSVSPTGTVAVKQVSGTSLTATPSTNYVFDSWTISGGGITPTTSTTNPQTFKATTTGGTIRANFADKWNLKGDQWDSWGTYKPLPNTGTNTFGTTLELVKGTTYQFKVVQRGATDTWYGNTNNAGNKVFSRGESAFTTTSGGSNNNLAITPDVSGTYTFSINTSGSTPTITITYQSAYTVTFGYGTGGSAVTASGSTDGAISSGNYVKAGDNVTFTQTPSSSGYTFKGWYTAASGGTAVSGMSTSDNVLDDIAANATVYAQYTANTYTVTFDKNGGTVTPSPTSKSVTFGSAYGELPSGMKHASKTFVGWFTESSGGTQVTAETIVSTASNHTLYAQYENVYAVNVDFKCEDAKVYPSTVVSASPTSLTPTIIAPEIFGYHFDNWSGSNVTFAEASNDTTTITADAATTVTANYSIVPTVYFKNNLGWDSVFVTFDCGFNSSKDNVPSNNGKAYYKMTQIGATDVFYCEIPASYISSWTGKIAFDNTNYGRTGSTTHVGTWDAFFGGECAGRGDFDANATLYIPYSGESQSRNNTKFYQTGCWMKYNSTESGYQVNMNTMVTGSNTDTLTIKLTAANAGGYEFSAKLNLKHPNYTYGFKLYKIYNSNTTDLWYTNTGTIYANTESLPWNFWSGSSITATSQRCGLHTEALGDYTITVSFATGRPEVNVEYPTQVGDWRLAYNDIAAWSGAKHDASWYIYSRVIKAKANAVDTVSFYVNKADSASAHIELQKCTAINAGTGAETWEKQGSNLDLSGLSGTGIYNFKVTQDGSKDVTSAVSIGGYEGNFYIRTDASDGGWNNYISSGKNVMTYSEYAKDNSGFTHYFMRFVNTGTNIKFCIANDYSPCLTEYCIDDDYTGEYIAIYGNVRFMWDHRTNAVTRAYISGSSVVSDRFLVLEGDAKLFDENGKALTEAGGGKIAGLNDNEMRFIDDQNWIYETTVEAIPGSKFKLTAKYNNKIQYFYGDEGSDPADSVLLLGGSGEDKYEMRIVYDFKTNRLIKAFVPEGAINTNLAIETDLMIIRDHQEDAKQITFGVSGRLSEVKTVYGAMKFNKYTLNGKERTDGHASTGASRFERDLFYISFPFDVKLNEAFGFGTYGKHWIIEYYDGKTRAANGFWADSDPNWKFVTPAQRNNGYTMKAFEGYILALDLDELTESSDVWNNGVENVYIYFPSSALVKDIAATNRLVTIDQTGYECTINRNTPDGDRRVKDSYWHCIGVPSFANYSSALYDTNGGTLINWSDANTDSDGDQWTTPNLPYLYEVNLSDKSLSVTSSATFSFKATWSYLVQYEKSSIYWSNVNVTPAAAIVARERKAPTNAEFRIELQQAGKKADQTFVRLTDEENITTGFDFNYDLSKEFNKNKANIYTMVTTVKEDGPSITEVAGNVQPMTEQTTVVPMGVTIAKAGEYTISIPSGTSGIGVTLVDNETGIRTNLALEDYTVALEAGTQNDRFYLEISPIKHVATGVEEITGDGSQVTGARKVMVDGILYIIKDGKVFSTQGARVK